MDRSRWSQKTNPKRIKNSTNPYTRLRWCIGCSARHKSKIEDMKQQEKEYNTLGR